MANGGGQQHARLRFADERTLHARGFQVPTAALVNTPSATALSRRRQPAGQQLGQ